MKPKKEHYERLRYYLANRVYSPRSMSNIDIDLLNYGWILPSTQPGIKGFLASPLGIQAFKDLRRRQSTKFDTHNTLASRLAQYLQVRSRITYENIELRASYEGRVRPCRPDVFSLMCTYKATKLHPFIHEVKVSRADFLNEVKNERKLALYSQLAERVFFVTPQDMVERQEIQEPYGLIYETKPNVFRLVKRALPNKVPRYRTAMWMRLVLKKGSTAR